MDLRLKGFGDGVDAHELKAVEVSTDSKAVLQLVYADLHEFTTHVSGDTMQSFLGMQPGGNSPFMPKVCLGCQHADAAKHLHVNACDLSKAHNMRGVYCTFRKEINAFVVTGPTYLSPEEGCRRR